MNAELDWTRYLKECLDSTEYCCLATGTSDSLWANPVYFSYDGDLNLYFISQPHSLHMKNIARAPAISLAIYNTSQSTHGDVCGIQLAANAQLLSDRETTAEAYDCYFGRVYPGERRNPKKGVQDYLGSSAAWIFVKLSPQEIWYFDTRFFGEERVKVPENIKIRGI